MAFERLYGWKSVSLIFALNRNSTGAPYETPIICAAHAPRILSRKASRERCRGCKALACDAAASAQSTKIAIEASLITALSFRRADRTTFHEFHRHAMNELIRFFARTNL